MVQRINGRLIFLYGRPKKEYSKLINLKYGISLLGILIGVFLLPNLAYLANITPEALIDLTNSARQEAGLNTLTTNQLLTQAAFNKGQAIMQSQNFSHTINNKKFSAWIRDTGYNYSYVGENLAIDFSSNEGVMRAWENSFLHKKNLLSPNYSQIGIAAIDGKFKGQDTTVVVQIFGAPAVGSVQPLSSASKFNSINQNKNSSKAALTDYQLSDEKNLLPSLMLNQELLSANDNKLILKTKNNLGVILNKFIGQSEFSTAITNSLIIFTSLISIYLILFLYYYYFLKINKLTSI